jgi:virginiamycin B lyase
MRIAMNRRRFLVTTAGLLAAPALLRHAAAQENGFRVKYFRCPKRSARAT